MSANELAVQEVKDERTPAEMHPERFCPNCSAELKEHRCKLSCQQCGFYLSCSDFY
jgi:ribosomal protein S27AE